MDRVTGIGGIFFKARDPKAMQAWYRRHLGIDVQDWGGAIFRPDDEQGASTVWSIQSADSETFASGTSPFVVNYRVADLHALLATLRKDGCKVLDKVDASEFGKFGWVIDPEGNKIGLWEPPTES